MPDITQCQSASVICKISSQMNIGWFAQPNAISQVVTKSKTPPSNPLYFLIPTARTISLSSTGGPIPPKGFASEMTNTLPSAEMIP